MNASPALGVSDFDYCALVASPNQTDRSTFSPLAQRVLAGFAALAVLATVGVLGMALLIGSIRGARSTSAWLDSTLPARAIVESSTTYTNTFPCPLLEYVVRFAPQSGSEIRTSVRETECHEIRDGDSVPIRYDGAAPTSARLATWREVWLGHLLWSAVGMFFLVAAVTLCWRTLRAFWRGW